MATECLQILLEQLGPRKSGSRRLTVCDFIGNCTSKSLAKEFNPKFAEKNIELKLTEDEEEEDDDEDEEESDPDEEGDVD